MNDINQALAPIRPILSLIGSAIIVAGLLKFFGVSIPVSGSGIELAAAGWLMKAV